MRRAAKVDATQGPIVKALRIVGASVQSLAAVGGGCPDLLVGYRGRNFVLEVKQEPTPTVNGVRGVRAKDDGARLNVTQERWFVAWRGQKAVVRSIRDAMCVIGAINDAGSHN